ncbi:hypothetical protein BSKO_06154 [Bryopsis sp. KO-2023]|nr:hypothetical protein BSKO_06154 [Bryopsis sp. KO-2023]
MNDASIDAMADPKLQELATLAAGGPIASALYVGDLDKVVDEGILYHLFSRVGPVASIRVCRDSVTRRSLGYAYVNFNTALDPNAAAKAIDALNYTFVKGKPIRIMRAMRDASARHSGVGNVFVKGLDPDIDSRTLHDTFEVFGAITSAKVARSETAESLGYGYVQYDSPESAVAAVQRANGMLLKGRQLYVAPYKSKQARGAGRGFTNIYAKNLPKTICTDEALRELFIEYGPITSVFLAKGDDLDQVKGFGFVNYTDAKAAMKAVDSMHGKEMDGVKLYVGPAQKKAVREKLLREKYDNIKKERQQACAGRNLYVKHLSLDVTDEQLQEMFAEFGQITSAKVMLDESGRSRGFGFVCFSSTEEALKAMTEMSNRVVGEQALYVALAQPKEARQAELQRQRLAGLGMAVGGGLDATGSFVGGVISNQSAWPQMMGNVGQGNMGGGGGGFMNNSRGRGRGRRGGRGGGRRSSSFGKPQGRALQEALRFDPMPMMGGLSTMAIAQSSPRQQKVMLGERLYPLIHGLEPERAAKVTGMLLEMDNAEILMLVDNPSALRMKVKEAVEVLDKHGLLQHPAAGFKKTKAFGKGVRVM